MAVELAQAIRSKGSAFVGLYNDDFCAFDSMILYIERDKSGNLICHFLTRGEGLQLNERGSVTHQERFALSFTPIRLDDSEYFTREIPDGRTLDFLTKLFELRKSILGDRVATSRMIYEFFLQIGKAWGCTPPGDKTLSLARGLCLSDQSVRLICRFLLEQNCGDHETALVAYKRLMFAYKTYALMQIGVKLCREQNSPYKKFVEEAVRHYALAAHKREKAFLMKMEEYAFSVALSDWVKNSVESALPYHQERQITSLLDEPRKHHEIILRNCESIADFSTDKISSHTSSFHFPTLAGPNDCYNFLKEIRGYWASHQRLVYFETMPIPVVENDPFWDKIPQDDVENCLKIILDRKIDFETDLHQTLLIKLFFLAVADKLMRRLPNNVLVDRYFHLGIEVLDASIFYSIGKESLRFEALCDYFRATAVINQRPLFFHSSKRDFKELVNLYKRTAGKLHGDSWVYQLEYQMAIKKMESESSQNSIEMTFKEFTINPKKTKWDLPKQFYFSTAALVGELQSGFVLGRNPGSELDKIEDERVKCSRPKECITSGNLLGDFSKTDQYSLFNSNLGRYNSLDATNFIAIFKKIPVKPENQVLALPPLLPRNHASNNYEDDTYRIIQMSKQNDLLRIMSAVKFMEENFFEVKNKDIFYALEWMLLAGTHLIRAVNQEPEIAVSLRNVVDKHLEFEMKTCATAWSSFLLWITLSYHIETHLLETLVSASCPERFDRLIKLVESLLKDFEEGNRFDALNDSNKTIIHYDIYLLFIYLSSHESQRPRHFVKAEFCLNLISKQVQESTYYIPRFRKMIEKRIEIARERWMPQPLNLENETPATLMALLPHKLKISIDDAVMEEGVGMPAIRFKNGMLYTFDFVAYQLLINHRSIQLDQLSHSLKVQIDRLFNGKPPQFFRQESQTEAAIYNFNHKQRFYFQTLDQRFLITQNNEICQKFPFADGWFVLKDEKECDFYLQQNERVWSRENTLVLTANHPTSVVARTKDGVLYRTNPQGRIPGNAEHLIQKWGAPLQQTHRLWGNQRGEPTKAEFKGFGGQKFEAIQTADGRRVFRSDRWKDYALAPVQSSKALGEITNFLLLEKIENPEHQLLIVEVNVGSEVRAFVYEVDVRHGRIYAQTVEAHLYLVYYYAEQGDYEVASELIKEINFQKNLIGQEIQVCNLILSLPGNYASLLGLQMRMVLTMLDDEILRKSHTNRISDSSLQKENIQRAYQQSLTLMLRAVDIYSRYIKVQTSPEVGPCPETIRLSPAEEKKVLKYIYNHTEELLESSHKKWSGNFEKSEEYALLVKLQKPLIYARSKRLGASRSNWIWTWEGSVNFKQHTQYQKLGATVFNITNQFWKDLFFLERLINFDSNDRLNDTKNPHVSMLSRYCISNEDKNFLFQALERDERTLASFDLDLQLRVSRMKKKDKAFLSLAGLMRQYPNNFRGLSKNRLSISDAAIIADKLTFKLSLTRSFYSWITVVMIDPRTTRIFKIFGTQKGKFVNTALSKIPLRIGLYTNQQPVIENRPCLGVVQKEDIENTIKSSKQASQNCLDEIIAIIALPTPEGMDPAALKLWLNLKNDLQSGEKKPLQMRQHLIPFVLKRNPDILKKEHPLLKDSDCARLFDLTIRYMMEEVTTNWLTSCLKTGKYQVVDFERRYDPLQHPELLVYEYMAETVLRSDPDQAKLLIELFDSLFSDQTQSYDAKKLNHFYLEFQAGGGKTKVVSAILALRAIQEGLLPIFFTLPEIHDITVDDLSSTMMRLFGIKTKELSIEQGALLSAERLKNIYIVLKGCLQKGELIVSNPETYNALYLDWQQALNRGDIDCIKYHTKIDGLFLNHVFLIIDESHRNEDPLLQANFANGETIGIPADQNGLLVDLYYVLSGLGDKEVFLDDGRNLAEVVGLRANRQALMSLSDKALVLKALAVWFCQKLEVDESWLDYLLDLKKPIPAGLRELRKGSESEKQKAELICFSRGLFTTVLPHVLALVDEMDYTLGSDGVAIPCYQKTPAKEKFESVDVAAAHTLQTLFQRGILDPVHMKMLMVRLQEMMKEQMYDATESEMTLIEQKFLEWQSGSEGRGFLLREIHPDSLNDEAYLQLLIDAIGKQHEAVTILYKDCIASKIVVYPFKWVSTASHLANNFKKCVHLSATLGKKELYTTMSESDCYKADPDFVQNVCRTALQEENKSVLWIDETTPRSFYESLYQNQDVAFDKIQGVINLAGWAKGSSNEDWAREFLAFADDKKLDFEGAVFAKNSVDPTSGNVTKHLYIVLKGSQNLIQLEGSNLGKELERLGIPNNSVFKIYGPGETTGTDLLLSPNMKMALTIGENLRQSNLVQAIMRMRGFLKPEMKQTLIWVGSPEIRAQIEVVTHGADVEHIIEWTKQNEQHHQRDAIISRAYQEIEYAVQIEIKNQIRAAKGKSKSQAALFKKHINAFKYRLGRNPYLMYGQQTITEATRTILERYRDTFAQAAGINMKRFPEALRRIEQTIQETVALVDEMETQHNASLSSHMKQQQQQQQKQKQKQKQKQIHKVSFFHKAMIRYGYADGGLNLKSSDLFAVSSKHYKSANSYFSTDIFTNALYLANNITETLRNRLIPIGKGFGLKRIDRLLLVEENGKRRFFAVDREDAESYIKQIRNNAESSNGRKAAVITPNGFIEQNGKGSWKIEGLREYLASAEFAQVRVQVETINGRIFHAEDFDEFTEKSTLEKVVTLWNRIKKERLVLKDSVNETHFNELIEKRKAIRLNNHSAPSWWSRLKGKVAGIFKSLSKICFGKLWGAAV